MKVENKILWVIFNVSFALFMLLSIYIRIMNEIQDIAEGYLRLLRLGVAVCAVFLILSVINFFVLNIDWSKLTKKRVEKNEKNV